MTTFYISFAVLALFFLCALAATIQYLTPEGLLDRLFDKKIIHGPDGSPYMHRWVIFRRRGLALFCHKFVRSDYDRALHDHPWDFLVIPIWRGYIEHSASINDFIPPERWKQLGERVFMEKRQRRVYPFIGARFRRAEYVHRVELLKRSISEHDIAVLKQRDVIIDEYLPSWSLFFRFTKRRHWGFWCREVWKPWVEGKPDHCEEGDQPYVVRHEKIQPA